MTKSPLLTQQDIKNFIIQQIKKAKPREQAYFVRNVICRKLGLNVYTFMRNYEKNGLKYSYTRGKRNYYNLNEVIRWLDEHNIPYTMDNSF